MSKLNSSLIIDILERLSDKEVAVFLKPELFGKYSTAKLLRNYKESLKGPPDGTPYTHIRDIVEGSIREWLVKCEAGCFASVQTPQCWVTCRFYDLCRKAHDARCEQTLAAIGISPDAVIIDEIQEFSSLSEYEMPLTKIIESQPIQDVEEEEPDTGSDRLYVNYESLDKTKARGYPVFDGVPEPVLPPKKEKKVIQSNDCMTLSDKKVSIAMRPMKPLPPPSVNVVPALPLTREAECPLTWEAEYIISKFHHDACISESLKRSLKLSASEKNKKNKEG